MKKVLYVHGGAEFHPSQAEGDLLANLLAYDGRFTLEMTTDLDAFVSLPGSDYSVVVVNTTRGPDDLTPEREKGLLAFIQGDGGLVGVHAAAGSFRNSRAYIEMLGCEFLYHPEFHEFKVSIVNKDHYITSRMPDYTIADEMYHLQGPRLEEVTLLAQTPWQGKQMPMMYVKKHGQGRVVYLAHGHDLRAWRNPEFQKLLIRAIAWGAGAEKPTRKIRCGLLGYGPAFSMGKTHANLINATEGMEAIAVCDVDPSRVEAARRELPGLQGYFTDLNDMLALPEVDLVVNILPHNLHAPTTLKCLEAGKHVIVEKPFCLTVAEADAMIGKAREKGLMLSVFHNRRWDDDYLAIRDLIGRRLIGDVFHVEAFIGDYAHPGFWWRSEKTISGGILYDWGAHFIDWILNLVPAKVTQVWGDLQKRVWHSVTNEDHGQVCLRFENGVTADFMISHIAASKRPKWRILGTKGSIELDWGQQEINLVSVASGIRQDSRVKIGARAPFGSEYYRNVADHLLMGEALAVKPEEARRVIAVIEAAQRSAAEGVSVALPAGCE